MSGDRDRPKSAAEVMAELRQDPGFIAREKQQEDDRRRNVERYQSAAHGVVTDLASVGYVVESVGDLRRLGRPYTEAVPVLVRWLTDVDYPPLKKDILQALSVPWARGASVALVREFERVEDATGTGIRWAIGNALEALASDEIAEEMFRLATERRFGRAREMVVLGLGKLRDPRVVEVLLNLLSDDEMMVPALGALGMLRATVARSRIEPFLTHPTPWVRKAAKKALARIDKAR